MSTIPTFSPRNRKSDSGVSKKNDETIERPWNFVSGLATKLLRLYTAPQAGAVLTSDADGNASWGTTVPSTSFTDSGETASQTATLVAAASGEYLATVYLQCTTAGTAGTLDCTFTHTDDIGSRTTPIVATIDLAATNRDDGIAVLRCSGGGIDFTLTVTGATGSPVYAAHISVTKVRG